jgi:ubiquinone/menaquinone biosynthesis C-methylase UbiE/uncharacterized protein YbaR (Trm112 family)
MSSFSGPTSVHSGVAAPTALEQIGPDKLRLVAQYIACPACHGGLSSQADEVRCERCGVGYPIVDDVLVLLPRGQDDVARRLRARYEVTRGGTSLPSVFRIAKRMLGDVRGSAVLDVGCSQGQFAFDHLLPSGAAAVIGVDFSAAAVREAQRRAARIPNALFVVGDAQALPIQNDRFDKVLITEVIEHLPDVDGCLTELKRVVAPHGDIVLSTPNYFNPIGAFKLLFDRFHHGGAEKFTYADHSEELEHFQTPFSVQRQFRRAGLNVRDFRGSDLWMAVRKALMMPWLLFDHGLRRALNLFKRDLLSRTFLKYFGVVLYYRLGK